MSEEQREWIIPLAYAECDAALAVYLQDVKRAGIAYQRSYRTVTAGSSIYALTLTLTGASNPLGGIRLRQVGERTYVYITPPAKYNDPNPYLALVNAVLRSFWDWYQEEVRRLEGLPLIPGAAEALQASIAAVAQAMPEDRTEPKRGDPMEVWLDWRDAELQRGRGRHAVSLPRIHEKSGFSLSTLKKRSAERNRLRGEEPKEEPL